MPSRRASSARISASNSARLSPNRGGAAYDIGPGHTPGTGNAQDLTDNALGKLLRVDVEGRLVDADDRIELGAEMGEPELNRLAKSMPVVLAGRRVPPPP